MKSHLLWAVWMLLALTASAQTNSWRVKFIAGPYSPGARAVEMTVTPERLSFAIASNKVISLRPLVVPMQAVTKIVYSDVEFNRGKEMAGSPSIFPLQGAQPSVAGANLGYLMVLGIASGMHGQKHYISVQWEEDGVEQELMVEASKETAPLLSAALEQAAGPKWMDLERRCSKAMEEIEKQREKAFDIALGSPVNAASFHLGAGNYRGVLLLNGDANGELYLFAESIAPGNLKAIVPVEVSAAAAATNKTDVTVSGTARLAEIHTPERTLRLR